jgi:hypothetical protein
MPNDLTEGTAEALDDLARFLWEVREIFYAFFEEGSRREWSPAPGSRAEEHFATELFPEDAGWDGVRRPANVALLLTYSGAEHLAGLAALLKAREVVLSAGALARVVYEHGVRAFLCLDDRV